MDKKILFLVLAIVILIIGIVVTFVATVPVFEVQQAASVAAQPSATTGMVVVNVVPGVAP